MNAPAANASITTLITAKMVNDNLEEARMDDDDSSFGFMEFLLQSFFCRTFLELPSTNHWVVGVGFRSFVRKRAIQAEARATR